MKARLIFSLFLSALLPIAGAAGLDKGELEVENLKSECGNRGES